MNTAANRLLHYWVALSRPRSGWVWSFSRCSREDPSRGRKFRALELCEIRRPELFVSVVRMVSVDVKQQWNSVRAQELCESRGGRAGLSIPKVRAVSVDVKQHWNIASELRDCVKVEVAVLGSLSLVVLMVSVEIKLEEVKTGPRRGKSTCKYFSLLLDLVIYSANRHTKEALSSFSFIFFSSFSLSSFLFFLLFFFFLLFYLLFLLFFFSFPFFFVCAWDLNSSGGTRARSLPMKRRNRFARDVLTILPHLPASSMLGRKRRVLTTVFSLMLHVDFSQTGRKIEWKSATCLCFPHSYGQIPWCRESMFSSFLWDCVYVFLIPIGLCLCFPHVMPCVYAFLIPMGRAFDAVSLCFPHFYGQGMWCRVSMFSSFLRPCVYAVLIPKCGTFFCRSYTDRVWAGITAARGFYGNYAVRVLEDKLQQGVSIGVIPTEFEQQHHHHHHHQQQQNCSKKFLWE